MLRRVLSDRQRMNMAPPRRGKSNPLPPRPGRGPLPARPPPGLTQRHGRWLGQLVQIRTISYTSASLTGARSRLAAGLPHGHGGRAYDVGHSQQSPRLRTQLPGYWAAINPPWEPWEPRAESCLQSRSQQDACVVLLKVRMHGGYLSPLLASLHACRPHQAIRCA